MEQKNYPKYHPGQFLTSDDLNHSFSYLDEQERLSRNTLLGYGILEGLSYKYDRNNGCLTINFGKAVTSDGYLITINSEKKYNSLFKYKKEMISDSKFHYLLDEGYLFYEETEQDINLGEPVAFPDISNYVLGIIVDLAEEKSVQCNQQSCDVNHLMINVVYRPVLILKTQGSRQFYELPNKMNVFYPRLNGVKTNRLINIIESRDLNLLQEKVKLLYKKNRDILTNWLKDMSKNNVFCNYGWLSTLSNVMLPENFSASVEKLSSMAETMTEIPSYYLLFLEDLKIAINEFVSFYNFYINTYRVYTYFTQKEQLIVLGNGNAPALQDEYRNVFRYVYPSPKQTSDCETASRLLIRIQKLIQSFLANQTPEINNTIKLIPSRDALAKLEERSIPHYYNHSEISPYWQAFITVPNQDIYHYKDFSNADYAGNLDKFPFLRLEGYYNQPVKTVYDCLNNLVEEKDLPVKVVKLELKKTSYIRKEYKDYILGLFKKNNDFKPEDKYKNIKKQLAKIEEIVNIVNYDLDNHRLKISPSQLIQAQKALLEINREDFKGYCSVLYGKELSPGYSYKELPSIAAFNVLNTMINEMYIKNQKPAEYLGGAYKNSTLVLLYYNDKVIMDINMPGYVEENSEKCDPTIVL